jgi:hypothetical protein
MDCVKRWREVALSTGDPLRHLRVTSVRSKVALSFDAHSLAQRHERRAKKAKLLVLPALGKSVATRAAGQREQRV